MLQPASRRAARHTSTSALKRFFAIADAWELSPLQQCRLLKIPSPQVLERYRLGQAPRLSATQQERAALIANIQYSLTAEPGPEGPRLGLGARAARGAALRRRQPAVLHVGKRPAGAAGSGPACWFAKASPVSCYSKGAGFRLRYTRELFRCECGGIGRRARLRIWWGNPCEFESRLSHHRMVAVADTSQPKRIDMQVSVESISKLERRMQVQVPAERVSQEIAARLQNLSRTARLKGFRPGKAPIKVIRQQFGVQVHREVIGELLQSSFAEAVTAEAAVAGRQSAHRAAKHRRGPGPQLCGDLRGVSRSRPAAHGNAGARAGDRGGDRERHRRHDRAAAQAANEVFAGRHAPRRAATRSASTFWARSTGSSLPAARARTSEWCSAKDGCCLNSNRV